VGLQFFHGSGYEFGSLVIERVDGTMNFAATIVVIAATL